MNVKGSLNIAGGFLIHLTLGTFFTIGNMSPYLISYLKRNNPSVNHSMSIWINAVSYVGQGSLMALGGFMEKKIGTRLTCIIGCIVFCGSIALTSLTIKYNFIAMVFTYGFFSCCGLSVAYIAPLSSGMKWFPKNKGLVNGIILSGYGLGALVFNQVQTALLNPHNKSANKEGYFDDKELLDGIPNVLMYLSAIYGSIQIVAILLLFQFKDQTKAKNQTQVVFTLVDAQNPKKTYGKDAVSLPDHFTKSSFNLIQKDLNPCQMLKRKEFYMFWSTFALHSQCVQFTNTYYKTYGQTFISDDHFLTTVGSIGSVFNCIGRIIWGTAQDKTSYKLVMLIISGSLTALMMTFTLVHFGHEAMFTIWVAGSYFFFSGIFPLFAAATAQAFGAKFAGTNFGVLYTAPAISSVIGAIVIQLLLLNVGYLATFCTIGSLTFIAFVITCFVPFQLETIS